MIISAIEEQQPISDARSSGGSGVIAVTSALAIALVTARYSHVPVLPEQRLRSDRTSGTLSSPVSLQHSLAGVVEEIRRVYDILAADQVELDADSKQALYSALWDMYA